MSLYRGPCGDTARPPRPMVVLALSLLTILLAACATMDQFIQTPKATFDSLDLTEATLLDCILTFNFNVNNPNPIGLQASRVTYDLKLNGVNFVRGQLDQGLSLPARGTVRMRIPMQINYLDFYKSVSQIVSTRCAAYELRGGFSVGPLTIPFRATGTLDLPQAPKFSLETIAINQLSWSGARLICRLRLTNPNGFDVLFKHLAYSLKLGDASVVQATAESGGPIPKNSAALLDLALNVSFTQIGRSAYQLLLGSKADYHMDGRLVFDNGGRQDQSLPFDLSGRVPLSKAR